MVGLAAVAVLGLPQRQQYVLIAHQPVAGIHARDLCLRIALPADIAFRQTALVPVDVGLGDLEALFPIDGITFGLVARQVLRVIGLGVAYGIVGQHLLDEVPAGCFAGAHLNIIVVSLHHAGNGIPFGIGLIFAIRPFSGLGASAASAILADDVGVVGPEG